MHHLDTRFEIGQRVRCPEFYLEDAVFIIMGFEMRTDGVLRYRLLGDSYQEQAHTIPFEQLGLRTEDRLVEVPEDIEKMCR